MAPEQLCLQATRCHSDTVQKSEEASTIIAVLSVTSFKTSRAGFPDLCCRTGKLITLAISSDN